MVSYPIELVAQCDGTYRVIAPHFPEMESFGDTAEDAKLHATFALEEVISARMAKQQVVPVPLKAASSDQSVVLPDAFAEMLESYWRYNLGINPPDRRP